MPFTVNAFHNYLSSLPPAERQAIRKAEREYLSGFRATLSAGPQVKAIRDSMEGWEETAAGKTHKPLTAAPNPEHLGSDEE
jgi:hypothetical protein